MAAAVSERIFFGLASLKFGLSVLNSATACDAWVQRPKKRSHQTSWAV